MKKIIKKVFCMTALTVVCLSCSSNSLKGEFVAQDFSVINRFNFLSSGKVEFSTMSQTSLGEYKIDENRVIISANGDNIIFMISEDGNCIDSGAMLGKYCKE